jgi:hypothetical protein
MAPSSPFGKCCAELSGQLGANGRKFPELTLKDVLIMCWMLAITLVASKLTMCVSDEPDSDIVALNDDLLAVALFISKIKIDMHMLIIRSRLPR